MNGTIIRRALPTGLYALAFGLAVLSYSCESDPPLSTLPIPSSDATLSSFTTSIVDFPGAFSPDVLTYSASVGLSTDTLLIQATTTDTSATVLIHDPEFAGQSFQLNSGATYGPANLIVGQNIFVIQVIASNSTTTLLYTLNVQRFPSDSTPL